MMGKSIFVGAGASLASSAVAMATLGFIVPPVWAEQVGVNSMAQITSVSQLRDVAPTDWAYEALRSLVERYGCLVGYPDRTYRGERALTRWEFAAGLNACLSVMERLIQENVNILREDIDKLKRLAQEFAAELSALGARVDNLEARVSFLEDHQFSTTTKLSGEVIFNYSGVWGAETAALDEPPGTSIDDGQIALNYRSRLFFDTSFTGEDLLRIRLQTANFQFARGGSNLTDYNYSANTDNQVTANKVFYRFTVGQDLTVWLASSRLNLDDISDPIAPFTSSYTQGAISFFGAIAPIYLINDNQGPGAGALYSFSDSLNLSLYYSAGEGFSPNQGQGLFNGQFGAGTQLTYTVSAGTGIGIAYLHNYFPQGFTSNFSVSGYMGVANSDAPFGDNATTSDNIALLWSWLITPGLSLEGWGMYTLANAQGGDRAGDRADLWNWKVSLALVDLFAEGNLGVITVGQPPYAATITNKNNVPDAIAATSDTPWLVETFYVFKITDNISVTPGVFVGINPENGRAPLWVGTIRTGFTF